MSVEWRDPEKAARGRKGLWLGLLEEVMTRPGHWAMARAYKSINTAHAMVWHLRNGTMMKVPAGRWTFYARTLPDHSGSEVYARYDGPE